MKRAFLFILFAVCAHASHAQTKVLSENFDVSCATPVGFPSQWGVYNPILGTYPDGAWRCGPSDGSSATPGLTCSGFYAGSFHLDTSYLITPVMNISGYADTNIYLRFDSKNTKLHIGGGRMGLFIAIDTDILHPTKLNYIEINANISPILGDDDSTSWVTHQVDLNSYKPAGNFYLAFRYTSTDTTGSIWSLDNISTSTKNIYESVPGIDNKALPLTAIGNSTANQVTISYTVRSAGVYQIAMYNIQGRQVHKEEFYCAAGAGTHTILGIDLQEGMYVIKMSDGFEYGCTKTFVK